MKTQTKQALLRLSRWLGQVGLSIVILSCLISCGVGIPPKELAPDGAIVTRAIEFHLNQTEIDLARQLNLKAPEIEIKNIRVRHIQPLFIAELPTYHLQGRYNLKIKLSRRQINQKNNYFDIYLQRQIEGKTWRLLTPEYGHRQAEETVTKNNHPSQWSSYLITD